MIATVERITAEQQSRQANCTNCLTRDCPLSGAVNSPVSVCNTFREANCALCATKECPLCGQLNSSVMACSSFKLFGLAD